MLSLLTLLKRVSWFKKLCCQYGPQGFFHSGQDDHWVQTSVKWDPSSRIFPFSEGLWSNTLTIRYCLITVGLFFNCFEITRTSNDRENNRSTVQRLKVNLHVGAWVAKTLTCDELKKFLSY